MDRDQEAIERSSDAEPAERTTRSGWAENEGTGHRQLVSVCTDEQQVVRSGLT